MGSLACFPRTILFLVDFLIIVRKSIPSVYRMKIDKKNVWELFVIFVITNEILVTCIVLTFYVNESPLFGFCIIIL